MENYLSNFLIFEMGVIFSVVLGDQIFQWQRLIMEIILTSIICECRIVATELMMESMHGLHIVVLIYSEPIELDRRRSRCS